MTYADILEVWAAAAAAADPTATYYRGRLSDISLESVNAVQTSLSAGGLKRNLIYAEDTQVATGNADVNGTESWRVRFGFLRQDSDSSEAMEQDQVQADEESREVIFTKTLVIARKFLSAIYNEDLFQITGTPTLTQVTRTLSGTFTGWGVDVNFVLPVGCEYDTPIPDAIYRNDEDAPTYQVSIKRGATWTAPKITVTESDGTERQQNANENVVCQFVAPSAPATYQLRDSAGNLIDTGSIPSGGDEPIEAPDGAINLVNTDGDAIATVTVRSNETKPSTVGNVAWTDSDGSAESTPYGDAIVCSPPDQDISAVFNPIAISNDTSGLWTNPGTTATFTSISDDGASGTITVSVNGGGFGAFSNPTVITNGQTLQVRRTVTTGVGTVTLTGTYA